MNLREIEKLDRNRTVFLMSVSPLEVHGPHLPLGTDVIISEAILGRYSRAIKQDFPELTPVKLPPLYLGADALPVNGSLPVKASLLREVLFNLGRGLAGQGFRYLLVADNHGGPRHQMAVEAASRRLWKKYRFYLIDSFGPEFRMMIHHHRELFQETGLKPGACGDDADAHAGTNETSLMLAAAPRKVSKDYRRVPPSLPPPPGRALLFFSGLLGAFSERLRLDLLHLARLTAWVSDPCMKPYLGRPALADREAGEAMMAWRVKVAMGLLSKAVKGEPVETAPMLWFLRFLQRF